MDFFFPDSQDQLDPSYDFERESSSLDRVRQRDDRYAHEVISPAPYTGILLSKALVDGPGSKYTFAQRHRLYRLGVRRFFRLDAGNGPRLATLGDCGAFNYVREEKPPYSVEEVIDFYEECGFDYGISVDHVILGYIPDATDVVRPLREAPQEWADRQELTLEYADAFLRRHRAINASFTPLGVAQGWSPTSYAHAVQRAPKSPERPSPAPNLSPRSVPSGTQADGRLPRTRESHWAAVPRSGTPCELTPAADAFGEEAHAGGASARPALVIGRASTARSPASPARRSREPGVSSVGVMADLGEGWEKR